MFGKQSVVDAVCVPYYGRLPYTDVFDMGKQLIDDIIASVGLKRADFNVVRLSHAMSRISLRTVHRLRRQKA